MLEQAVDCAGVLRNKPADLLALRNEAPADLLALRNEAIACLTLPDLRLEQEWEGNPPGTNGLAFDAHFGRYAWSRQNEEVRNAVALGRKSQ